MRSGSVIPRSAGVARWRLDEAPGHGRLAGVAVAVEGPRRLLDEQRSLDGVGEQLGEPPALQQRDVVGRALEVGDRRLRRRASDAATVSSAPARTLWPEPVSSACSTRASRATWACSPRMARRTSMHKMFSVPSQMVWHCASRSWRAMGQSSMYPLPPRTSRPVDAAHSAMRVQRILASGTRMRRTRRPDSASWAPTGRRRALVGGGHARLEVDEHVDEGLAHEGIAVDAVAELRAARRVDGGLEERAAVDAEPHERHAEPAAVDHLHHAVDAPPVARRVGVDRIPRRRRARRTRRPATPGRRRATPRRWARRRSRAWA